MSRKAEDTRARPQVALAIATGLGLGYLPLGPGTWASLASVLLWWCLERIASRFPLPHFFLGLIVILGAALVGLWAAGRAAEYLGRHDPQVVVIDEISGQHVALFVGGAAVNWKYLLLGLILFRVFDIWKPFPVQQTEKLPGGWGIMADDWVAGGYAALGLWLARSLGL